MHGTRLTPITALVLVIGAASCDGTRPTDMAHGHEHSAATPSSVKLNSELAIQVRAATARFHSKAQAAAAGYAEASPCVASPAGGMGYHWVNGPLVDPVFDPNNPEAILYGPDGKLIAVEYIVINVGQPAPTFAGQAFDVGGSPVPVAHWTLHAWLYERNSTGLFSAFNPAVVCS